MTAATTNLVRVRVWDRVVRSTHWLIVVSIVVLAATGFAIGHPFVDAPGEARAHFVMGTIRVVHFYFAIVFTLAVLSRIAWMFLGKGHARWTELVPVSAERRRAMLPTLAFYGFARKEPPPAVGHNPLAGFAYLVVFVLYLVLVATGLAMYAVDAVHSPVSFASALLPLFGGAEGARLVHHVSMWLVLGFAVNHVYSAVLTAAVERNGTMESIFSGTKWVPPELAAKDHDVEKDTR